jgi:hypothetical protein
VAPGPTSIVDELPSSPGRPVASAAASGSNVDVASSGGSPESSGKPVSSGNSVSSVGDGESEVAAAGDPIMLSTLELARSVGRVWVASAKSEASERVELSGNSGKSRTSEVGVGVGDPESELTLNVDEGKSDPELTTVMPVLVDALEVSDSRLLERLDEPAAELPEEAVSDTLDETEDEPADPLLSELEDEDTRLPLLSEETLVVVDCASRVCNSRAPRMKAFMMASR